MMRRTHRTTVAGVTLDLPLHKDPETTEQIARQVTERIREIEDNSTRIDTQAFALTAAVSFAIDLAESKADQEAETAETVKALSAILARLDEIVAAYGSAGRPNLR